MFSMPSAKIGMAAAILFALTAGTGYAQSQQEIAQLRLYIQQLEQQIRLLTGENERLLFELRQLQAQAGVDPNAPANSGSLAGNLLAADPSLAQSENTSIAVDDPRVAGDGATSDLAAVATTGGAQVGSGGGPIDLSALAGGSQSLNPDMTGSGQFVQQSTDVGADLAANTTIAALPADSKAAYDIAYGYVLTGDYALAEQQFRSWLATFPGDPQSGDAEFWLGESQYQQGKYRDSASTFLELYKQSPNSRKGPDALLKLGMSLAALGEAKAACATFSEFGKKYPSAALALNGRVQAEASKAGC